MPRPTATPAACALCATTGSASGDASRTTPCLELLRHLYVCEELSTYRIGVHVGLDRQRVTRMLRGSGVPLRPRGAGRSRPHARAADPADLRSLLDALYVQERLSSRQIGLVLGMPERRVRTRLRELGISRRTRGSYNREDRETLAPERLRELYARHGLSADQVAAKLASSRAVVLRSAHDEGVPVRPGAAAQNDSMHGEIELIEALYGDPLVHDAVTRHGLPVLPAGGPIWQRIPDPVPLSARLVRDLYARCGVGLHHIELLTGQPEATIRRFMETHGIARRPAGGRTPFLRRWANGTHRRPRRGSRPRTATQQKRKRTR